MPRLSRIPFSSGQWVLVGAGYHLAALAALHLLQSHRSAASAPLSTYVLGRGGFGMVLACFALGLALVAAGVGALQTVRPGRARTGAVALLFAGGAVSALAGVFPTDGQLPPALPVTPAGWIHLAAGVASLPCLLLAPILFQRAIREDRRWSDLRPVLGVLAVGVAVATVFAMVAPSLGMAGLAQRCLTGVLLVWLFAVGARIRRVRLGPPKGPRVLLRVKPDPPSGLETLLGEERRERGEARTGLPEPDRQPVVLSSSPPG